MTRAMLALVVALVLALPVEAAGPPCGSGGQLVPAGYQQLTVSSTAVSLTVPTNAIYAEVVVGTESIRYRNDGTAPTGSVGVPYGVTALPQTFTICGKSTLAATQLIRITNDSVVNIHYYAP